MNGFYDLITCENSLCSNLIAEGEGVSAYGTHRFCSDECAYEFGPKKYGEEGLNSQTTLRRQKEG